MRQRLQTRPGALRIALVYALCAAVWIETSSRALDWLVSDADARARVEEFKGLAFVLVTAAILALSLRRYFVSLERTEGELRIANEQLTELAEYPRRSPHPVLELGPAGDVVFANEAALARAAGSSGGLSDLLPHDMPALIQQCLNGHAPLAPVDAQRGEATWRWWMFPRVETGRVWALGLDRTEEVRLARQVTQAARMESVGRMAAGLAHDFNNVLTAIGGYTELIGMQAAQDDEELQRDAREIREQVDRARKLVRHLMSIGRVSALEPATLDLNERLATITPMLSHLVHRGVDVQVLPAASAVSLFLDPAELEQIVMNLVSNASDAMSDGGTVTIAASADGDDTLLEVADTGGGIEAENLSRIFDPFFTTKSPDRGTGLGLASVYSIVQRSGATITVSSEVGRGTTFVIRFPAHSGPAVGAASTGAVRAAGD